MLLDGEEKRMWRSHREREREDDVERGGREGQRGRERERQSRVGHVSVP